MNAYLDIRNLSKRFEIGTVNEKIALNNLSLCANKGDFITVLGSNGAGKSTLFNTILGKFKSDAGSIYLDDDDITNQKDYKRALHIGCLFQDPMRGTAPNMTIEENMALAYTRKSSRSFFAVNKKDSAYFKDLLSTLGLGLEDRLKTNMGLLSGGQRQAAALLMATISQPKLLLLDEHTAALDPATSKKVLEITQSIVEQNKLTTLMITHDLNQALAMGNRTIMMNSGQIILDITGEKRANMTPKMLIEMFSASAKTMLEDRTIFSAVE